MGAPQKVVQCVGVTETQTPIPAGSLELGAMGTPGQATLLPEEDI